MNVEILTPKVFPDYRGMFMEFDQSTDGFCQINISTSKQWVIRGLHYQEKTPQTKVVSVLRGIIFDAWVDIRQESPNYGKWGAVILNGMDYKKIVIPKGFAHGYLVLSPEAEVIYKVDQPRAEEDERVIRWDSIGINWPLEEGVAPILSSRDASAPAFRINN